MPASAGLVLDALAGHPTSRSSRAGFPASNYRGACQVPASDPLTSRFSLIFDRAMVGIAYTSARGSILEANRKFHLGLYSFCGLRV